MRHIGGSSVAAVAFHATGGDPLAALLLVLDLIWAGRLAVGITGFDWIEEPIAA